MDLGLGGKVAIVAAASRGLGLACAQGLAAEGARVAMCARDAGGVAAAAQAVREACGEEPYARACDVTDRGQVEDFVQGVAERFGRIDILVTNAGGPPRMSFAETSMEDWEKALRLNLLSTVALCRAVVPHMKREGGGRIVHIASISAKQPLDGLILSNAARSGVLGFSKTLAQELAPHGILVNAVLPGYTRTQRVVDIARAKAAQEGTTESEAYRAWERQIPLGRLGEPKEFADVVVFLCSARASYVTGTAVQVDGGFVQSVI